MVQPVSIVGGTTVLEQPPAIRALFTRSSVDGRSFLRFSVGGRLTERRHVQAGWELLQELASDFT